MEIIPKIAVTAKSLVIADLAADKMDGQIAACILQGIVNRNQEEKIYVENTYCCDNRGDWNRHEDIPGGRMVQIAQQWLDEIYGDLPQTVLGAESDEDYPMFLALLKKYRRFVKGVIIYDLRLPDATIEAATTIAGQTDAIAVSPELYERISGENLTVVEDLRSYCFASNVAVLGWLKRKYFEKANKAVGFTWSHMDLSRYSWGAANKDYVVANRLFTYYLDIEDEKERLHYKDIVSEYPKGTPVLGWTDEIYADAAFAKMGCFMIPFISVENMSVASSFPTQQFEKPEIREPQLDPEAIYIAFHVADGDNLEHSLVYQPNTIRRDPAFGKLPVTWIQNPIMTELAPRAMQWHREVLEAAGQESAAMLGDGSPFSEGYEGFHYYCRFVKHFMDQAGMRTMKQMSEAEAVAWNVKPEVIIGGYSGFDARGIRPYEYHLDGDTFHVGSVSLGETDIVKLMRERPKDRPLFLSVFSATASEKICSKIQAYAKEWTEEFPDEKFVFVTSAQAGRLYKRWQEQYGRR